MTSTRYRFPTATLLMLLAAVAVVIIALTLQKSGPQDLGGSELLKQNNTSQGAGNGGKACPPKSVYGVGQPANKGCGNRPPPGQAKKNP